MTPSKSSYATKNFSPFAQKMKTVAFAVVVCALLISAPIVWLAGGKYPFPIMVTGAANVIGIIVWFYLSAILFQFYRHTKLREYIFHVHTFWLSVAIVFPFVGILSNLSTPFLSVAEPTFYQLFVFTFYAILLVIFAIVNVMGKRRTQQMNIEIQGSTAIWKRLLEMDMKSIVLLQFPNNR